MQELSNNEQNRVLVVVAHADDETLGCGGSIARWVKEGKRVDVLCLGDGVGARSKKDFERQCQERRQMAQQAGERLGVHSWEFHNLPDNRFDTIDLLDIVQRVEAVIEKYQPGIMVTHHKADLNIDHQRTHEAVVTACRPQAGHSVHTLLFFEVPSATEWQVPDTTTAFQPNWFVDISATWMEKKQALQAYAEEMRPWPHPRSIEGIEHLAAWRGATVGVARAEAFVLGRAIR